MSTSKIGGLSARISSTYPIRAQAQARGLESGWSRTSEPTGPGRFAQCVDPVTVWRDRQLLPFGTLSGVYDSVARQFNNSIPVALTDHLAHAAGCGAKVAKLRPSDQG